MITPPAFTFKEAVDINPMPVLGPAYLAAVLEKSGIEVKIFDSLIEGWQNRQEIDDRLIRIGATFTDIEKVIRDFGPDLVGVSNLFSRQRANAHKIYEITKKIDPAIITVAGGAHPSAMPEAVMEDTNVDFVVIGEGEETLRGLIDVLGGRGQPQELDGVAFRSNGILRVAPKKSFIQDLDSLPFPSRHLLNMEKYFGLESSHGKRRYRRFTPIVTSRGCPAGCVFCSAHCVWGRKYRSRSVENILRELRLLKERYAIKELLIEDDNVTLDIGRANKLFDAMIEEKLDFAWDTPNGVAAFALTNDLVKKMKDAGCYKLNIAVESGCQRVLSNIIKKPLRLENVQALIKYARKIGLDTGIFLILGIPGEKIEEMKESFRFAQRLGVYDPFVSIATPYPGSELYRICREKGYIAGDYDLDNLFITSFSISTQDWKGEEVKGIFDSGYLFLKRYFYLRHPLLCLKYIMRKVFSDPLGLLRKIALAQKGI